MAEDRKTSLTNLVEKTKRMLTVQLAAVKEGAEIQKEKSQKSSV